MSKLSITHYYPTPLLHRDYRENRRMTIEYGNLYTHTTLEGLFIVVYKSEERIGLHSFTNGKVRYINILSFRSQYRPIAQDIP